MARRSHTNTSLLKHLIYRRGSRCEFCGEVVVCVALVRRRNRIKLTASHLTYRNGLGQRVTERIATVEHIQRRADGGGNRLDNVAVACVFCNQERNRRHHPKRKTCKQCGRPFAEGGGRHHPRGRSCRECHERTQQFFKPEQFGTSLGSLLSEAIGENS